MKSYLRPACALALLALVVAPAAARAQCENPAVATAATQALAATQTVNINQYLQQEVNFTNYDLQKTATKEVMDRLDQFRNNLLSALNSYAEKIVPNMKLSEKQISAMKVDQTSQLGAMTDSQLQTETINKMNEQEGKVRRDSQPSVSACVLDSTAPAQTRAQRLGRAIARGIANDGRRISGNMKGSIGANGTAAVAAKLADDALTKYCDPQAGDPGCTTAGPLAGRNNDLSSLLWGSKKTIDTSQSGNTEIMQTVAANIAGPLVPNPIPATEVNSAAGKQETMMRRSMRARQDTVYNALGQMLGQRVGAPGGANTRDVQTAAGKKDEDVAEEGSYRETQEAISGDRFTNPEFLFQVVNYPATLVREMGAINALRLMQLSDLYQRTEDLVWMEGAVLGKMLDDRKK